MATACAPVPAVEVPDELLVSGAAIHSIAAPRGKSVVVVISPADCLSCDLDLSRWFTAGRDTAAQVSIVLTREPTADEARNLTVLRLPVAGRLASGRRIDAPCVLQFDDGKPTSSRCDPP